MIGRHNILFCQNILYRNCIFQYIFLHFSADMTIFCSQCTIKCLGSGENLGRVGKPETHTHTHTYIYIYIFFFFFFFFFLAIDLLIKSEQLKSLRSNGKDVFKIFSKPAYYDRSFSVNGAKLWNSLQLKVDRTFGLIRNPLAKYIKS